jgi:hypothetical protein
VQDGTERAQGPVLQVHDFQALGLVQQMSPIPSTQGDNCVHQAWVVKGHRETHVPRIDLDLESQSHERKSPPIEIQNFRHPGWQPVEIRELQARTSPYKTRACGDGLMTGQYQFEFGIRRFSIGFRRIEDTGCCRKCPRSVAWREGLGIFAFPQSLRTRARQAEPSSLDARFLHKGKVCTACEGDTFVFLPGRISNARRGRCLSTELPATGDAAQPA